MRCVSNTTPWPSHVLLYRMISLWLVAFFTTRTSHGQHLSSRVGISGPLIKRDAHDNVLRCKIRMRTRPWVTQLHMLPVRFLRPREVLANNLQVMEVGSQRANQCLLVVVNRASKFLFACPWPN